MARKFKIKTRILAVVMPLILISGIMASLNIVRIKQMNDSYNDIFAKQSRQINMIDEINQKFLYLRISANLMLSYVDNTDQAAKMSANVEKAYKEFNQSIADYKTYTANNPVLSVSKNFFQEAESLSQSYKSKFDDLALGMSQNRFSAEDKRASVVDISDTLITFLKNAVADVNASGGVTNELAAEEFASAAFISIIAQVCVLVISAIATFLLSKGITKPLTAIEEVAQKAASGNLNFEIDLSGHDEVASLSQSINTVLNEFEAIISEMNEVIAQINAGNSKARMESGKYEGIYKSMAGAFNGVIDGLMEDVADTVSYIKSYANGSLNINIRPFPGDKAVINEGLVLLKGNLVQLIGDIDMLSKASSNGELDVRIDTTRYSGEWEMIVKKLNGVIEGIAVPVRESISVLEQMKKGQLGQRVEGGYKGEYLAMKQALNQSLDTIQEYIKDASEKLAEISNQNLNIVIEKDYIGDFITFKTSINSIIYNLNHIMLDIQDSSSKVAGAAKLISSSTESLSRRASAQDVAVDSLAKSVNEVEKQTSANVEMTIKADDLATKTKNIAVEGNKEMKDLVVHMDEISVASKGISNIIGVIDNIAFETNLLALNASVEAARAGQHGKGFAVVAEEVRSLAASCGSAAKDISTLIQSTVTKVAEGAAIAGQTAATLQLIVEHIMQISDYLVNVTQFSKEEISAIKDINDIVGEISQISAENAAATFEGADSSSELLKYAELFHVMVNKFTLMNAKTLGTKSEAKDMALTKPVAKMPVTNPTAPNPSKPVYNAPINTTKPTNFNAISLPAQKKPQSSTAMPTQTYDSGHAAGEPKTGLSTQPTFTPKPRNSAATAVKAVVSTGQTGLPATPVGLTKPVPAHTSTINKSASAPGAWAKPTNTTAQRPAERITQSSFKAPTAKSVGVAGQSPVKPPLTSAKPSSMAKPANTGGQTATAKPTMAATQKPAPWAAPKPNVSASPRQSAISSQLAKSNEQAGDKAAKPARRASDQTDAILKNRPKYQESGYNFESKDYGKYSR